jgi:uncharacterized protein YdhG (YjbR/CyaY superfamily)
VSAEEVDKYLRGVEEPKRSVLQTLRGTILEIVPEAEQVISYGIPAFRVRGKTVCRLCGVQDSPKLPACQRLGPRRRL